MSERDVEEVVRLIISERLDVKPEEVTLQASFVDDLRADPLEVAELIMALQEEFNVVIQEEPAALATVADAIRCVESRLYE